MKFEELKKTLSNLITQNENFKTLVPDNKHQLQYLKGKIDAYQNILDLIVDIER